MTSSSEDIFFYREEDVVLATSALQYLRQTFPNSGLSYGIANSGYGEHKGKRGIMSSRRDKHIIDMIYVAYDAYRQGWQDAFKANNND